MTCLEGLERAPSLLSPVCWDTGGSAEGHQLCVVHCVSQLLFNTPCAGRTDESLQLCS